MCKFSCVPEIFGIGRGQIPMTASKSPHSLHWEDRNQDVSNP